MIWTALTHFPNYEISEDGQVRNIKTDRLLKPIMRRGKPKFGLMAPDGKQYMRYVHKLLDGQGIEPTLGARRPAPVDDGTTWKTVPGFEHYEANELGLVRNRSNGRSRRTTKHNGCVAVVLRKDGKSVTNLLHYVIAAAFFPGFDREKHFVRHKNGDSSDNRADNLLVRERGLKLPPPVDEAEFAARKAEREAKRRASFMETIERRRAEQVEKKRDRVLGYNAAIAQAAEERKKQKPQPRSGRDKTRKEIEAELSGWIEMVEGQWHATIKRDGKPQALGVFESLRDAARAQRDAHASAQLRRDQPMSAETPNRDKPWIFPDLCRNALEAH